MLKELTGDIRLLTQKTMQKSREKVMLWIYLQYLQFLRFQLLCRGQTAN
jgi:hypothetical protein